MTPAAVATPFPPLNPTNTENTCENGRYPARQREQLGVGYLWGEHQDRDSTLGDVDYSGGDSVLPAEDPIEIGGAEVAAAVLPKIDSREESAEQIARRYGSHKIGSEKP